VEPFEMRVVRDAYDSVAEDYAYAFADDLRRLPVDLAVLDEAAVHLRGGAAVLDLGCGPAQVGHYLAERGVRIFGADLSSGMLDLARRRTLVQAVACADMRSLPCRSGSLAGVIAFYSIQHVPRAELAGVLDELRRVLRPRGLLVLAAHLGEGEVFSDEFLGHQIERTGATLYARTELERALHGHSFKVETVRQRGPLPHEHQSRRLYLIARQL
jgi:SAM-dependent methyltransferase